MFWLGLATAGSYVSGWTGATVPTSWVVLSCALPALALWRPVKFTVLHWAVFSFVCITALSCLWAYDRYDAVWGLWQVVMLGLAFWLGSTLGSLKPIFAGLGVGASASAIVEFFQYAGYQPVLTHLDNISGLYFNSMAAGEILALIILGCVIYRLHWLVPLPAIGLALTHSHGGWLALALGLTVLRVRSLMLIAICALAVAVVFTYSLRPSDVERLQIWYAVATNLVPFGHGPGSLLSLYWFPNPTHFVQPEYAHNDFLQLAFEYGVLAIVPIAILCSLATRNGSMEWPIFIAFLFMACFSFPLYTPVASFIGALVAGRLARDWDLAWSDCRDWRPNLLLRLPTARSAYDRHRS